jgi:Flp pilus assembly protein TadB
MGAPTSAPEEEVMDSSAGRPQSPRPNKGSIASLGWLVGLALSAVASFIAVILAVALAASVVVVAVMGGALLALAGMASRARRPVKARNPAGSQIIEARNVGGHSWVAYGWDRRP